MIFKKCPSCHFQWPDRETFLSDPTLEIIGYQANFYDLEAGFFLFNHEAPGCGTSLAIEVEQFADLHSGPIFETRTTGTESCPGYCANDKSLDPCTSKCECAYVRDVIQRVKKWPKTHLKKAS